MADEQRGFWRRWAWWTVATFLGCFGAALLANSIRWGFPRSWGDWVGIVILALIPTGGFLFSRRVRETLETLDTHGPPDNH